MSTYQLKGNPVVPVVPVVGNLIYDEVGKEVLALHNERFKGVKDIEDTTNYQYTQPISFSNIPRVLSYAQILRERFPELHVLSPQEILHRDPEKGLIYWNAIPQRDTTYADTDSITVFPKEGSNEDLRQRALYLIGKDKTEVPLIVSGLTVEKADNTPGFTFTKSSNPKVTEAPFLTQNQKLIYNPSSGLIIPSEEGVMIYTPSSQSGLRRLCRNRSDGLYARADDFLSSDGRGRVQLVQDPKGRAENLEDTLVKQLQQERDNQIKEAERVARERYAGAVNYLRTGKL